MSSSASPNLLGRSIDFHNSAPFHLPSKLLLIKSTITPHRVEDTCETVGHATIIIRLPRRAPPSFRVDAHMDQRTGLSKDTNLTLILI